MKKSFLLFAALTLWIPCLAHAASLSAGFTYQGRLTDNGSPANGAYDMRFTLHSASSGANTQVGGTIQIASVLVTNGLFKEELDFGASPFDGEDRWLEIGVRPGGGTNSFTVLDPRQRLSPAPYALFAPAAGTAKGVAANAVSVTQLNTGAAPVNGQVLAYNGTALVWTNASTVASAWTLNGNAGTTPGVNFLGTTDNEPLELWVNGSRALRLEPKTNGGPNVTGGSSDNLIATDSVVSATIGGGDHNSIQSGAWNSTISGGCCNTVQLDASYSFIGGGYGNVIQTQAVYSVLGGGLANEIQRKAEYSTVGGGLRNLIRDNAAHGTIGGGSGNEIQEGATDSTIGGGHGNWIETNSVRSSIGGGSGNVLNNAGWSTIAGGVNNVILNSAACSVGGGIGNRVEDRTSYSTVSGGIANVIRTNADYATIGGGDANICDGSHATVPGGMLNNASGDFSFAAGSRAKANHTGAFVWADSSGFDFQSLQTNEFAVRATGGARFVSGIDTNGTPVAGVTLPAGSGSWSSLSDRNAKTNFTPINPRELLERLAQLPIQTWNYKTQSESVRHIGPTAQDFAAAFRVGEDDLHIATVDEGGVALAAIQGLIQKVEQKETEITELKQRLEKLEKLLE